LNKCVDCKCEVIGVTTLKTFLYVMIASSKDLVQIYDARTLDRLGQSLTICSLEQYDVWSLCGPTSCASNNCLYISDSASEVVYRVDLKNQLSANKMNLSVKKWRVEGEPKGISVNASLNVLVACGRTVRIKEYTKDGQLVRSIVLQFELRTPFHVVQMPGSGVHRYVVSHDGRLTHGVCIVDAEGRVLSKNNSKLNDPKYLFVDSEGYILLADSKNNRIVALSPSLNTACDMPLSANIGLNEPRSLHLHFDKSLSCLFVSEDNGTRVLAFDNIDNIKSYVHPTRM